MTGREALADALAAELDLDIEPRLMAGVDRVLIRLWLHGYSVTRMPGSTEEASANIDAKP